MGFYGDRVLPWTVDKLLDNPGYHRLRESTTDGLAGTVLEIGFGSGLNVPFYPAEVERVYAVDPATYGRQLARNRLAASPVPVDFIDLDSATLALDDNSADGALCTFTLCSIADIGTALGEITRVLRPGGRLHFLEHGLAHHANPRQIQRALTPLWRHLAGGCHLDRDPTALLEYHGMEVDVTHPPSRGPDALATLYQGTARTAG